MIEISGKIIHGQNLGTKIGYPTINIDRRGFNKLQTKPKFGVYYGAVFLENKKYKAGIVIGPNDSKGLPKIEAHLIDFSANVYGKYAKIQIQGFVRKFKKFKNVIDLNSQIKKDIIICKKKTKI